jgi:hypothetical protein
MGIDWFAADDARVGWATDDWATADSPTEPAATDGWAAEAAAERRAREEAEMDRPTTEWLIEHGFVADAEE